MGILSLTLLSTVSVLGCICSKYPLFSMVALCSLARKKTGFATGVHLLTFEMLGGAVLFYLFRPAGLTRHHPNL